MEGWNISVYHIKKYNKKIEIKEIKPVQRTVCGMNQAFFFLHDAQAQG